MDGTALIHENKTLFFTKRDGQNERMKQVSTAVTAFQLIKINFHPDFIQLTNSEEKQTSALVGSISCSSGCDSGTGELTHEPDPSSPLPASLPPEHGQT